MRRRTWEPDRPTLLVATGWAGLVLASIAVLVAIVVVASWVRFQVFPVEPSDYQRCLDQHGTYRSDDGDFSCTPPPEEGHRGA